MDLLGYLCAIMVEYHTGIHACMPVGQVTLGYETHGYYVMYACFVTVFDCSIKLHLWGFHAAFIPCKERQFWVWPSWIQQVPAIAGRGVLRTNSHCQITLRLRREGIIRAILSWAGRRRFLKQTVSGDGKVFFLRGELNDYNALPM